MKINGRVHCFFEQSGTFKKEFIKLGIPAEDYDIQDNFGETDHNIDLFAEIEKGYKGEPSIFDNISPDDLILAFFPCIYFTGFTNPRYFTLENNNYRNLSDKEKFEAILDRADKRNEFYKLLVKLAAVVHLRGLRMIVENPYTVNHYLHNNFLQEPAVIDKDRRQRGDYFSKPTGFWFFGCQPTAGGKTYQKPKKTLTILSSKSGTSAGICSEERSMISPDYARNFICDFILGKEQEGTQMALDF